MQITIPPPLGVSFVCESYFFGIETILKLVAKDIYFLIIKLKIINNIKIVIKLNSIYITLKIFNFRIVFFN